MSTPMPTDADLRDIGAAVLGLVAATVTLGHETPGETLTYIHRGHGESLGATLAADLVAWTSRQGDYTEAENRLRDYVLDSGWQRHALERMAHQMGAG